MNDCFICDATTSFLVWKTEGGSWADDALFTGLAPTPLGAADATVDFDADYVYLYQVLNTNHVPLPFVDPGTGQVIEAEGDLVNFHVLNRQPGKSLFSSGGYLDAVFRDSTGQVRGDIDADDAGNAGGDGDGNYTLAVDDFADDAYAGQGLWEQQGAQASGTPSDDIAPDFFASPQRNGGDTNFNQLVGDQGPDQPSDGRPSRSGIGGVDLAALTDLTGVAFPVSLDLLFQPQPPLFESTQTVANFAWAGGFGVGMTSPVLFLTSDAAPVYDFGSTQSAGFPGAAGDVPTAPVPATTALLGLGLATLGWQRRRR
jgi:hypothetical protein